MAPGQEGTEPELDEEEEEDEEDDPVEEFVVVVGAGAGVGVGGTTMATQLDPFQTCPVEQVMQVTPLKYELGGQEATQLPL